MSRGGRPPLILQRRFLPLWLLVCASAFNDNMLRQALIIAIVYGTVSASVFADPADAIPAIGALFSTATLLCTSAAGQVAEKYETAMLLRRTKLAELGLLALAGVGFALESGTVLMAALIGLSVQIAFFNPVRIAAMPKVLRAEELVLGNAFCSAGLFVSVVLGLYLGGVLIDLEAGGFIVSGILITVAAAAFLASLFAPRGAPEAPDLKIDWNPVGQTARLLAQAFSEPAVWRPLIGVAFFYLVSTATTILVPLYAIEELGADGPAATSIMGVFAIGAGAGAIAAAAISRRRSGLGFSFAGVVSAGFATATVFGLTQIVAATGSSRTLAELASHISGVVLLGGFFLCAASMGLFLVPLQAAAQRRAPHGKRARVLAAGNILSAIFAMAGSLGVLLVTNTALSPADGLLILAALQLSIGAYMALRWFALPDGFHDDMLLAGGEPEPSM